VGTLQKGMRVRIMRRLPSKILLGRRFILRLNMRLEFSRGLGSFTAPTKVGCGTRSGRILSFDVPDNGCEHVRVVHEADVPEAIAELDLSMFGEWEDQARLRDLLLEFQEVFIPSTATVSGFEFKLELSEGADVAKLNRAPFSKSRMEQEVEADEVRKLIGLGIVVPSTSEHATNNVIVAKKRIPNGASGGLRVTSDFRALNSLTTS
jgi:hypothetical protein